MQSQPPENEAFVEQVKNQYTVCLPKHETLDSLKLAIPVTSMPEPTLNVLELRIAKGSIFFDLFSYLYVAIS